MANTYKHYNIGSASKYDDFDPTKNYVKVLYNPSRAVQARELTQSQTYLNYQLGAMGGYLFKDGQPIEGANITFSESQPIVEVRIPDLPPNESIDSFMKIILKNYNICKSSTTNQEIRIESYKIKYSENPDVGDTLYLLFSYLGGDIVDGTLVNTFLRNDKCDFTLVNSPKTALVAGCTQGTIFVDGYFIHVPASSIMICEVDKTNTSYTETEYYVGFDIERKEVDANEDISLNDNAIGSYNYKAPGANRYQIKANLVSYTKDVALLKDNSKELRYISGIIIKNGVLLKEQPAEYDSALTDMLARRTYEESGSYSVTPWKVTTNALTDSDRIPVSEKRDDYYGVNISPGLGYIYGYRRSNLVTKRLINKKAREITTKSNIVKRINDGVYVIADLTISKHIFDIGEVVDICGGASNIDEKLGTCRIVGYDSMEGKFLKVYIAEPTYSMESAKYLKSQTYPTTQFLKLKRTNGKTEVSGSNQIQIIKTGYSMVAAHDGTKDKIDVLNKSKRYSYIEKFQKTLDDSSTGIIVNGTNNEGTKVFQKMVCVIDSSGNHLDADSGTVVATANNIYWNHNDLQEEKTYTCYALYTIKSNASSTTRKKIPTKVTKTFTNYNGANEITLDEEDVIRIVSLTVNGANKENIHKYFTIKNVQTDFVYDKGKLIAQDEAMKLVNATIIVEYEYYNHSTGNGPFIASSYPDYKNIPSYRSASGEVYDLRDCLDFRVKKSTLETTVPHWIGYNSVLEYDIALYKSRIDLVYIDKNGDFGIINGIDSLNPAPPYEIAGTMGLYYLHNEPYGENVRLQYIKNNRHTMKDITSIENRISNMENVISLSLLEQDAVNMHITDVDGKNRYKTGIFTDNFTSYKNCDYTDKNWSCAIDAVECSVRPDFDCKYLDFKYYAPNSSVHNILNNTSNVSNWNNVLLTKTPKATSRIIFKNEALTEATNIQSLMFVTWNGSLQLIPSVDNWVDELDDVTISNKDEVSKNTTPPNDYRSWSLNINSVTGVDVNRNSETSVDSAWRRTTTTTTNTTTTSVNYDSYQLNAKLESSIVLNDISYEQKEETYEFMRRRDVRFCIKGMRPGAKIKKVFFDNKVIFDASVDPKVGLYPIEYTGIDESGNILWSRVPTDINGNIDNKYYDPTVIYNGTSKKPVGTTIKNSDGSVTGFVEYEPGDLHGCFQVPANQPCNEGIPVVVKFIFEKPTDRGLSANYSASGKSVWTQTTLTYIRDWDQVLTSSKSGSGNFVHREVDVDEIDSGGDGGEGNDPIAESFFIDSTIYPNGVMLESIDIYFAKKDDSVGVEVYIVECENGYPTTNIVPFSSVLVPSADVKILDDETLGEIRINEEESIDNYATNFKFSSPLYLNPSVEYAFIVYAPSLKYEIYTSKLGMADLITGEGVEDQPYIGSMFKSQNKRTWTAEQNSDITFKMYAYEFDTENDSSVAQFNIEPSKDLGGNYVNFRSAMQTISFNSFVPPKTNILYFYSWDNGAGWTQFYNKEDIFNRVMKDVVDENKLPNLIVKCFLSTNDKNVSPIIDLEKVYGIFTKNKCKKMEENLYSCGSYVSIPINLEQPSSDLRVIADIIRPNNSKVEAFYSTQPIVMRYFLKGSKGCCSFIPEDNSLKEKSYSIFSYGINDTSDLMTYTNSECYISQYTPVPSEAVYETKFDDGTVVGQYSNGRVFVNSLSNEEVIKNVVVETDDKPNKGYYFLDTSTMFFANNTTSSFNVVEYKNPIYEIYDIVQHNGKYYCCFVDNNPQDVPGTTTAWKIVPNLTSLDAIPDFNLQTSYIAFSVVKVRVDNAYKYYVNKQNASGQELTNKAYWNEAELVGSWCYPKGSYVFYTDETTKNTLLYVCNPSDTTKQNAGFNTPSSNSVLWKEVKGIKVVSPLILYDDREWKKMICSDANITLTEEQKSTFTEYTFTPGVDDIQGEFGYFAIKMDLYSQDEINVPRIKNLRAIALA